MNLSKMSEKIADDLTVELDCNDDKKEIIAYAIETVLLFILEMILIILLGLILNVLWPTVIAAIIGGSLRKLSGGAHFNTPQKCLIFGAVVYSFIGLLVKRLVLMGLTQTYFTIILLLSSFLIMLFLAPVDSEAKPIHSKSFKLRLKILSMILIVAVSIVIHVIDKSLFTMSSTLGLFYQSLTLLPIFNKRR